MPRPAAPPAPERRHERRRGPLRPLLDALYTALRWIGGHVRGFYAAVGLFLVLALLVSIAATLLFFTIARVVAGGAVQRADTAVLLWLSEHRNPVLDTLALFGTAIGSGTVTYVVLVIGIVVLWRSRHHYSALLLILALVGGRLLIGVLKTAYGRPRPRLFGEDEFRALGMSFEYPGGESFPSGHALTAVIVFGTLAFLVARLEPTRRMRRATLAAALALILLIGFSRLYFGVHYPSDVIAGFLAGLVWAIMSALTIEAIRYFATRKPGVRAEEKDLEQGIRPLKEALEGGGGERVNG